MRLNHLWIEDFKNLRDLDVEFDGGSPYTVLVGENGAGKSNLIEVIATIFRHLDLEERSSLAYRLTYTIRDLQIRVTTQANDWPTIEVRPRETSASGVEDAGFRT